MPTYDEILNNIMDYMKDAGITYFGESSTARAIAEVTARGLASLSNDIDVLLSSTDIDQAQGTQLDKIGSLFGLRRRGSTQAESATSVQFSVEPGYTVAQLIAMVNEVSSLPITEIVIDSGTKISKRDNASVIYETTEEYTLTDTPTYTPVKSVGIGSTYNVDIGTLTIHNVAINQWQLRTIATHIKVNNLVAISSGVGSESDEEFRRRIKNARLAAVSGNETAISEAALTVPGVNQVLITKYPEGLGTVGVVVLPYSGVANTHTLMGVYEAVNDIVSAGCRAVVSSPEYILINMKAELVFRHDVSTSRRSELIQLAKYRIISYINGLSIGDTLGKNDIVETLRSVGINGEIVGANIVYIKVSNEYKSIKVTKTGRGQTVTDVSHNPGVTEVYSEKLVSKLSNPPQKFIATSESIVIC